MALRRLRMEQGMTKTKAAELIGVSPSTISRAETGERGINRDDLAGLLVVYKTKRSLRNALLKLHREAQNPDMLVRVTCTFTVCRNGSASSRTRPASAATSHC
jgi:transcriptional regulator with XRE-family HTH domain